MTWAWTWLKRHSLLGFGLLAFSSSLTWAAGLSLDWLPEPIRSQVENLPSGGADHNPDSSRADLFLCDPYCERVGQFYSNTDFRPESTDVLSAAKDPKSAPLLKIFVDPLRAIENGDVARSHELNGATATATREKENVPIKKDASSDQAPVQPEQQGESTPPEGESPERVIPLLVGAHLDAGVGATSLSTTGNTDVASDAQTHLIIGGGLDGEARNLVDLGGGTIDVGVDLSAWGAISEKSKTAISGQTWGTQIVRGLISGIWRPNHSDWRVGFLLEARYETDSTSPETAQAFSTKYLWGSAGLGLGYGKTELKFLQSLYNSTQDPAQYRGTSVSSSRLALELSSCKSLFGLFGGEFDICGVGSYSKFSVTGSGTPSDPAFTVDPTSNYSSWTVGLQFKLAEISL